MRDRDLHIYLVHIVMFVCSLIKLFIGVYLYNILI